MKLSNASPYLPLGPVLSQNGSIYTLIKRTHNVCLYAQRYKGNDAIIAYEVFKVRRQKETTLEKQEVTIHLEARELMPLTTKWGQQAFSCFTLKRAEVRFKELSDRYDIN